MSISSVLSGIGSKISGNVGKYALKGVGIAALGMIAYDSHVAGKINADSYQKKCDASAASRAWQNTTTLTKPSAIQAKMKKTLFNFELDNNIRGFFNSIAGYAGGFGSMLVSNIVPLALGTATVITKGLPSKISAAGLGIYGVVSLVQDIFGFGSKKHLDSPFK